MRDALKPDSLCLAWYAPAIDGLEPDFVVYTPEVGIVFFEVKDWLLEQIREADHHAVTLCLPDGRTEKRTHPFRQAREYVFGIMNRIKAVCPQLVSSDPRYQGRVRLPFGWGVVFSNIRREDFLAAGLHSVLPPDAMFFADDLAFALAAKDGKIREKLAAMFPPKFPFHMSASDIAALRDVVWPQVRIVLPKRGGQSAIQDPEDAILRLDAQQESLARRLDATEALIEGPAGSGKTLVLVHRAVQELQRLQRGGSDLPVLFICFNLTLVHYLKRLLAGQRAPLGKNGIRVMHFYNFCRSLIAEPLVYENEDMSYYGLVVQMALEASQHSAKYGAVFVDEGQDISDGMMAVLHAVRAEGACLWVACDMAQDLYTPKRHWLSSGMFRKFLLREPYRSSRCLAAFCERIAEHEAPLPSSATETFPVFAVNLPVGSAPVLRQVADPAHGAACIAAKILTLHDQGVPYSEIIVLYATNRHSGMAEGNVPEFLRETLEAQGILVNWVSHDAHSKSAWDITTDSVSLSTIHSMKGLDAKAVFVFGLDMLDEGSMSLDRQRTLAYVACTRARQYLEIVFCQKTPLLKELCAAALVGTVISPQNGRA